MKNTFLLIIVFIGIGMSAFAEDKSNREQKGDKHFFVFSFDKAIYFYTRTKQLTVEGHRRLAESYQNMRQNSDAEETYFNLISNSVGVLPEDHYMYARLLKINGKIEESNRAMDKFVELKPNDLRGKDYKANKDEFANFSKDDGRYKINLLDINTEAEDFAPVYYKEQIVYASSRSKAKMIVRNNNWTGNPFYDLYVADVEKDQLKNPMIFAKALDGKMHDGPASFSKDGNFMAYTRNNYEIERNNKVVKLEIFFSHFEDGKWTTPESFFLNDTAYSVGHPSLTADGNTMYFTSDVPGGFGGADIYKVTKDNNGVWGNMKNLGDKINTEGDETFPFIEENSSTLFFSSNGRFGLGGLDVFIAELYGYEVGRVYNAGAPLNTKYDDYGVIVNDKMTKGYFSSNRTGGSGSDDIYAFDLLKLKEVEKMLSGIAKDDDNNLLSETFIALFDDEDNMIDSLTTKEDGAFSFTVKTDKKFTLTGKKENYNDGKTTANTSGEERNISVDVILLKESEIVEADIIEKPKPGDDLGKKLDFNPKTIYFDYGKYEIRKDAIKDLDKIIKVMNENPNMVIELGSHTDCVSSKEFNQTLSDNRAKASANYIKKGITKPSRISGKGYGKTKLVNNCSCSDCSDEDHQQNRRTEFIVIRE